MNVGAMRFRVPGRTLLVIIPLVTVLGASGIWNIRQYRLIERQRLRELAAEREETARAKAEAEQAEARMKKKAEWARSDARVQQLYREIDRLSQINEHRLVQQPRQRSTPTGGAGHGEADDLP